MNLSCVPLKNQLNGQTLAFVCSSNRSYEGFESGTSSTGWIKLSTSSDNADGSGQPWKNEAYVTARNKSPFDKGNMPADYNTNKSNVRYYVAANGVPKGTMITKFNTTTNSPYDNLQDVVNINATGLSIGGQSPIWIARLDNTSQDPSAPFGGIAAAMSTQTLVDDLMSKAYGSDGKFKLT